MTETKQFETIMKYFQRTGEIVHIETLTEGLVNSTYRVAIKNGDQIKRYIVQRINKVAFKEPEKIMSNIINVTDYLKKQNKSLPKEQQIKTLNFLTSIDNNTLFYDNNECWRVSDNIENTITYGLTNDEQIITETGLAFGDFASRLSDFPIDKLYETIPNFHDTESRYANLLASVIKDKVGRRNEVLEEIEEYKKIVHIATQMTKMQKSGELPTRVTHNDTKCNNVLFSKDKHYKCVIDLDTIMPGLIGFDFGDAIRFLASTAKEDEEDLSKVSLDLNKFEHFTRGFLSKVGPSLTKKEQETLALGAITMTTECGMRFLTDYLDGDVYFRINPDDPKHNLKRARCHLKLALDMISKRVKMQEIVDKYLLNPALNNSQNVFGKIQQ